MTQKLIHYNQSMSRTPTDNRFSTQLRNSQTMPMNMYQQRHDGAEFNKTMGFQSKFMNEEDYGSRNIIINEVQNLSVNATPIDKKQSIVYNQEKEIFEIPIMPSSIRVNDEQARNEENMQLYHTMQNINMDPQKAAPVMRPTDRAGPLNYSSQ